MTLTGGTGEPKECAWPAGRLLNAARRVLMMPIAEHTGLFSDWFQHSIARTERHAGYADTRTRRRGQKRGRATGIAGKLLKKLVGR